MLDEINGVKVKRGTTEAELASVIAYWCGKCKAKLGR